MNKSKYLLLSRHVPDFSVDYDEGECETMFGGGNAESGPPMQLVAEAEEGKLTIHKVPGLKKFLK